MSPDYSLVVSSSLAALSTAKDRYVDVHAEHGTIEEGIGSALCFARAMNGNQYICKTMRNRCRAIGMSMCAE